MKNDPISVNWPKKNNSSSDCLDFYCNEGKKVQSFYFCLNLCDLAKIKAF